MLTTCPECELPVSTKAIACPHCGYPLAKPASKRASPTKSHKRLPNGFGRITKISAGNLRNPWRAMVTVGTDTNGRPIAKILKPQGYFATYNEAYEALMEYNKNPYDLNENMTVKMLFEKWSAGYFEKYDSKSYIRTLTSAWSYCSAVYDLPVRELRARHIKCCMEEGKALVRGEYKSPTADAKARIKSIFNMMLDYAMEYELVDRNYARSFDITETVYKEIEDNTKEHIAFENDEMQALWNHLEMDFVDVVLIQCYMGWRPQEIGLLETANVDMKKNIIVGGMKTPSGKRRTVPICSKIRPLVEARYNDAVAKGNKYFITCTIDKTHEENVFVNYDRYLWRYQKIISNLGLNPEHRLHDPRKQFSTMCKAMKVDEYALKRAMGHKIRDITEALYTSRPETWLNEEIEKISLFDYEEKEKEL